MEGASGVIMSNSNSSAARRWDIAHSSKPPNRNSNTTANAIPSHLYTDENPATTIKGTGFKNKRIAQRTIELTSQPGARYKQYWTIRAMRERAAHHPHQTEGMRDAIAIFDEWLSKKYKEPSVEEKAMFAKEWETFRQLCISDSNANSYGKDPSKEELDRARKNISEGQRLLFQLLSECRPDRESSGTAFPLLSFVAIFGGPGLHGYGKHIIDTRLSTSQIAIEGIDGIEELLGSVKTRKLPLASSSQVKIYYHRKQELARATIQQTGSTLEGLWRKSNVHVGSKEKLNSKRKRHEDEGSQYGSEDDSWTCLSCTYIHTGERKLSYLACEVCGSQRISTTKNS